jgi:hypothetical protein
MKQSEIWAVRGKFVRWIPKWLLSKFFVCISILPNGMDI